MPRKGDGSMNRPKADGTYHETSVVKLYLEAGVRAKRNETNAKSWDVLLLDHPDLPVECKFRRKTLTMPEWIKNIKGHGGDWVIHVHQGDLRTKEALGRFVVLNEDLYFDMMKELTGGLREAC